MTGSRDGRRDAEGTAYDLQELPKTNNNNAQATTKTNSILFASHSALRANEFHFFIYGNCARSATKIGEGNKFLNPEWKQISESDKRRGKLS